MKTHGYCLTINNPKEADWLPFCKLEEPEEPPFGWSPIHQDKQGWVTKHEFKIMHSVMHKHGIQYIIYGKERGKNGTQHYQMFVCFRRTTSFNKVKKIFPRAHIEHTRGTFKEARDYCAKEEKFFEYGYDAATCRDNIERDQFLMNAASEESDLRSDISLLTSKMEELEKTFEQQNVLITKLLKVLIEKEGGKGVGLGD